MFLLNYYKKTTESVLKLYFLIIIVLILKIGSRYMDIRHVALDPRAIFALPKYMSVAVALFPSSTLSLSLSHSNAEVN